jgi:hypothetical protein
MSVALKTWTDSLEHAAVEVAELALGFEGSATIASEVAAPANVGGAYMPLFGGNGESLFIGWLATDEASQTLARGLLGLPATEVVPAADVADAMGEAVNILAGGVKRRMLSSVHPLALGLPIFSPVPLTPIHAATFACELRCGDVISHLVLMRASGGQTQQR